MIALYGLVLKIVSFILFTHLGIYPAGKPPVYGGSLTHRYQANTGNIKHNHQADIVVDLLKKALQNEYGSVEDDAVVKITGASDKPLQLIRLPEGCRWGDLVSKDGIDQMNFYRETLLKLGTSSNMPQVQAIFANAQTALKKPQILNKLVKSIDELDWYSAKEEGLGDLYEGLLEKNASEKKSGAGQYFTPRPLIDCMVELIKPQPGELTQDPAAGTGGFLIACDRYIKRHTDDLFDLSEAEQSFQRHQAFCGIELVQDAHRLLLMNMLLHGIESTVSLGDTLSGDGQQLPKADVILTNPPEPDVIAAEIMSKLQTALEEMEALTALLEGEV